MKLNNLKPNKGSRKEKYRAARGMAQGRGKQAGKGQSGQKKRSKIRPGFEGGQNPWYRRVPKRGFNNINRIEYQIINLLTLEKKFKNGEKVNINSLKKLNILNKNKPIKLLGHGKLTKNLIIQVNKASKSAIKSIQKVGGKVELI